MTAKRQVEVFSAGCWICDETVTLVREMACPSCEVTVHDMKAISSAHRARQLGIRSVPAVAIDGKLAACCTGRGIEESALRAAGLGRAA